MSKVSIVTLPFRKNFFIKPVYEAMLAQTYKDLEVIAVINDPADGSKEIIQRDYPQVKLVEPGTNTFFAKGVNLGIKASSGEFIQLVNDDLILEPNYIEEMLKAFDDPQVAAATGKILRYDFEKKQKINIIDTTGIILSSSGRAKDRGQLQIDQGQYDNDDDQDIFGVSGAGAMFRRSALESVKFEQEYFDEDFIMYWEDVDLSWRLKNANYVVKYVPSAIAYHGRTAGQAQGGYLHLLNFIKHHKKLNQQILKWNYKNHILMYIKNAKFIFHPLFIGREIAMLGYIVVFETSTLKVIPELFRQLPRIWKKRKAARTRRSAGMSGRREA